MRNQNQHLLSSSILLIGLALGLLLLTGGVAVAAPPPQAIRDAHLTGGIVAQVGADDLLLKELGERFHVRLLLPDAAAVAKAQAAINQAGLQGREPATDALTPGKKEQ